MLCVFTRINYISSLRISSASSLGYLAGLPGPQQLPPGVFSAEEAAEEGGGRAAGGGGGQAGGGGRGEAGAAGGGVVSLVSAVGLDTCLAKQLPGGQGDF